MKVTTALKAILKEKGIDIKNNLVFSDSRKNKTATGVKFSHMFFDATTLASIINKMKEKGFLFISAKEVKKGYFNGTRFTFYNL